ncbi:MAG: type VI secretion system tube protein TssD [Nannocystaceae bacterium]
MKKLIRSIVVAACLAGVTLTPFAEASAALNAYLKLKGQKQGQIRGSVTKKGREDSIMVIAVSHSIVSPRDAASGLPTGKRQHKPIVITKELDKSSPLLLSALVNNETLSSFALTIYGGAKKDTALYTIELTNAQITSIDLRVREDGTPVTDVAFTYQKIQWTWHDGGITAQDDWSNAKKK